MLVVNNKSIQTTLAERKGIIEADGVYFRLYESREVESFRVKHINRFFGLLRLAIEENRLGNLKNDQIFHITLGTKTLFQICGYAQYGEDRNEIDFVITHIDTVEKTDHLWQIA